MSKSSGKPSQADGVEIAHLYDGNCPDKLQPGAFDPRCPRCAADRSARAPVAVEGAESDSVEKVLTEMFRDVLSLRAMPPSKMPTLGEHGETCYNAGRESAYDVAADMVEDHALRLRALLSRAQGKGQQPAADPSDDQAEYLALIRAGKKIEAMKLYRNRRSTSLREAADAIERLIEQSRSAEHGDPRG